MNRRVAAITSLAVLAASVVLAVALGVQSFPRGLSVLACFATASLAAWWALIHRGAARVAAATSAGRCSPARWCW
jgi:cyanate permease